MEIKRIGYHTIEFGNAFFDNIYIRFDGGKIRVSLKHESENLEIVTDSFTGLDKLVSIINYGPTKEELEYLRLFNKIVSDRTQAKYFDMFAKGELTLQKLRDVVERSTKPKAKPSEAEEQLLESIPKTFVKVCKDDFDNYLFYKKVDEYDIIVVLDYYSAIGKYYKISSIVVIGNQHGITILDCSNWNIYALYKLLNGDARLFKKRVGANNEYLDIRFREILKSPKEIFDKNVYEYLMTAVVLCDIAVN
jgi:hypothetical protein